MKKRLAEYTDYFDVFKIFVTFFFAEGIATLKCYFHRKRDLIGVFNNSFDNDSNPCD